jgi:hypothetical protein
MDGEVISMLPTYKAILRGDRIEWDDEVPEQVRSEQPLAVYVTVLTQPAHADGDQGRRMAQALEQLAARGGTLSIADPVAWEREQRQDRELTGRR